MALRIPRQLTLVGISLVILALITASLHFLIPTSRAHAAGYTWVGPKKYYLGLGDSLAFGYQPNLDWSHGYVQDFYSNLKNHGVGSLTDYGCNGEKSTTMINGGCPYAYALHNYYFVPQLTAAVNFITGHAGAVSPVTLDMGANDVLPDINSSTCVVSANWSTDLATLHSNLVNTILPKLVKALTNSSGQRTGDLIMTNYYNPFAAQCPADGSYIQQLNTELANDAAQFNIPLVDTYTAFGGSNEATYTCTYTWMCSSYHDIHATGTGYQVMANAFISTAGY